MIRDLKSIIMASATKRIIPIDSDLLYSKEVFERLICIGLHTFTTLGLSVNEIINSLSP